MEKDDLFVLHWSIIHDWLRTDYNAAARDKIDQFLNISQKFVYEENPKVFLTFEVYAELRKKLNQYEAFANLPELVTIYSCNDKCSAVDSILKCASQKCFKKKVWLVAHSQKFGAYVAANLYTFPVIDINVALDIISFDK